MGIICQMIEGQTERAPDTQSRDDGRDDGYDEVKCDISGIWLRIAWKEGISCKALATWDGRGRPT
jgi:hypothetical protein